MSKLAVLILAAGNSSRMGVPKQLLKWKGTNLLQHTINTVSEVDADHIILVLGANFEKIKPNISTDQITVLYNKYWEKGLGNTIAFGIKYIKESLPNIENVIVLLADQPLVDSNYLNKMISIHNLISNKITCTLYKQGKFGVPAIFNRKYFEELSQLNQDNGAKNILKKYSEILSSVDGENFNLDIDTMEDYETLYKSHH